MIFGSGDFRYELVPGWENSLLPYGIGTVPGICIQRGRLFVLSRNDPPILELDTDGTVLDFWGNGVFSRAHGVFVSERDRIFCADDAGHAVYLFNKNHILIKTLGQKGHPSDTGCIGKQWKTILRSAGPFNYPTNVTEADNGDIYVSDGYGNARVHVFDSNGNLKFSWGKPGTAPGAFNLPHSLRFDAKGTLYVCDRANNRIQLFSKDGDYHGEWDCFERPADLFIDNSKGLIYVAECKRSSVFNGTPSRITILNFEGDVLVRLGGDLEYVPGCGHHTAHGITVDSDGNIYVAEVGQDFPAGYIGLKKYRRV